MNSFTSYLLFRSAFSGWASGKFEIPNGWSGKFLIPKPEFDILSCYDTPMLFTVILVSITVASVVSLLYAIRVGDRPLEVLSKSSGSVAFVALGFVRWSAGNPAETWLIAALALCAIGDFCLLWKRAFDYGLITFVLGHLAYVAGFTTALPLARWPLLVLAPLVATGFAASRWLWPHLGRRRLPVTVYVLVISFMVWGGISTATSGVLPWTAAVGAVLFYCSDLAVARQRFVAESFINRAVGLPVYYLGQLLLALTIGAG